MLSHLSANESFIDKKYFYVISMLLAAAFVFYQSGQMPVVEWDEARNGLNALEMLRNGDWLNYYYAGEPDNWNAKPPLLIWLIALSFRCFGYHELSLRLPTLLASLLCIHYLFRLVSLFKSQYYALLVCLCLLGVSGFMGVHVAKTADFDVLLLGFILGGLYHLTGYAFSGQRQSIYMAALFLALAGLTKGFTVLMVFPALVAYTWLTFDKNKWNFDLLVACLLIVLGMVAWPLVQYKFGALYSNAAYGANAVEVMWWNDVWARFTNQNFSEGSPKSWQDYFYFFVYLDSKFAYWYIAFYATLWLAVRKLAKVGPHSFWQRLRSDPLLLLSVLMLVPIGLFLSLVPNVHFWYMTPALPFLAILSSWSLLYFWQYNHQLLRLAIVLFCVANLAIRWQRLSEYPPRPAIFDQSRAALREASQISLYGKLPSQDLLLYINFENEHILYKKGSSKVELPAEAIGWISKNIPFRLPADYQKVAENVHFLVVKKK